MTRSKNIRQEEEISIRQYRLIVVEKINGKMNELVTIGIARSDDEIFRKLVKARLSYPASKSATVEYLKNHFDEDVSLTKIYRYLDKPNDNQHRIVQNIPGKYWKVTWDFQ